MIIQSCFDTRQFLERISEMFCFCKHQKIPNKILKSNNVVLNILLPWQRTDQHIKSFLDLQPR